jgi:hypothetical protein
MGYRLDWRLVGRDNRHLDGGEIDSGFRDRRSALAALGAFLHQFAFWSRDGEPDNWWAKRSEDADLQVFIRLREEVPSEDDALPAKWATRKGEPAPRQLAAYQSSTAFIEQISEEGSDVPRS